MLTSCSLGDIGNNNQNNADKIDDEIFEIYKLYLSSDGTLTYNEWLKAITGKDGKDGNGIKKVEKTKVEGLVDTYTITFSDGTTVEFTITNGKDGKDAVVADGTPGLAYYPLDDGSYAVGVGEAKYLSEIVIPETYNGAPVTTIEPTYDKDGPDTIYAYSGFACCENLK